jgi:tetratricopeptide (TPR) repeat protein
MRIHRCLITIILLVMVGGLASGQEPKGWLGFDEQLDVTKVATDKTGLNAPQGVKVGYVVPGSPADKAGLKAGDLILSIDFKNGEDVVAAISAKHPGDEVQLQVLSAGRERQLRVTVAEWPKAQVDCYQRDNADLSVQGCTTLIEQDPNYSVLYGNRAYAYLIKGDYDRALGDYTRAIEIDPKYALTHFNRGYAYVAKGEYDRAIADYDKALEIDPKNMLAYLNRGYAYAAKGEHDRAVVDYNKTLEIDPKNMLAHFNRGRSYAAKGEYDRAIADYDKALEIDPGVILRQPG